MELEHRYSQFIAAHAISPPWTSGAPLHWESMSAVSRAWPVCTCYVGTCVSPLQSAEGPKDVNKVMARFVGRDGAHV
jgi:hypothetical protein